MADQSDNIFGMPVASPNGGLPTDGWDDASLEAEPVVTNAGPSTATPEPAPGQGAPPPAEPQQPAPQPQPTPAPEPAQPAQPQPQAPQQPQPQQPQAPEGAQPTATPQEQQQQAAEEARKWAGRYATPEQLEEGYKNIRRLQVQTAERAAQDRQRYETERLQVAQLLQQLQPVLADPDVRARLQGVALPGAQPGQAAPPPDLSQMTPEQFQAYVRSEAQRVASQQVQQVTQQQQSQQADNEVRMVVQTFLNSNPDVVPGSEMDHAIGDVMAELQTDSEGNHRPELFPYSLQNLEAAKQLAADPALFKTVVDLDLVPDSDTLAIAREAQQNPAFYKQLRANPTYVDTPEGIELAREMASLPGLYANAAQAAAPPSPEAMRLAAQVESGGTGAPMTSAPGQVPMDEFDEAIASWQSGQGNIFGLHIPQDA